MAVDTTIGQAAQQIGPIAWTESDPVSLAWTINTDWSGPYKAEIRKSHTPVSTKVGEFAITAVFDGTVTLFTMTITEDDSALIKVGTYYTDIQLIDGVTRVWAKVVVAPQVTVMP